MKLVVWVLWHGKRYYFLAKAECPLIGASLTSGSRILLDNILQPESSSGVNLPNQIRTYGDVVVLRSGAINHLNQHTFVKP